LAVSAATGTSTKSGSPRYAARSAKANFIASAMRCMLADDPAPLRARSKPSRMLSISISATPPEDTGGKAWTS
jgi:hypothetical protein